MTDRVSFEHRCDVIELWFQAYTSHRFWPFVLLKVNWNFDNVFFICYHIAVLVIDKIVLSYYHKTYLPMLITVIVVLIFGIVVFVLEIILCFIQAQRYDISRIQS